MIYFDGLVATALGFGLIHALWQGRVGIGRRRVIVVLRSRSPLLYWALVAICTILWLSCLHAVWGDIQAERQIAAQSASKPR
jgi:hypothetical protein